VFSGAVAPSEIARQEWLAEPSKNPAPSSCTNSTCYNNPLGALCALGGQSFQSWQNHHYPKGIHFFLAFLVKLEICVSKQRSLKKMKTSQINDTPEERWSSPNGRYEVFRKSVSLALGGIKDVGEWGGGHPFDVELSRVPPGKSNFPLHNHSAQTEIYLITEGNGVLHSETETMELRPGMAIYCAPGDSHRIESNGPTDLIYFVIADNPRSDICSYPETGKMFMKPQRRCILPKDADYFGPED